MGQEIDSNRFSGKDLSEFQRRLKNETEILRTWIDRGRLNNRDLWGGCELEAWLIDKSGRPAPINQAFLERLHSDMVVPELSIFNIELNTHPGPLCASLIGQMHDELDQLFGDCESTAKTLNADLLLIGILPTVRQADLCLENITGLKRYIALNEQIFRLRQGRPLRLDIEGRDKLHLTHDDVMLEAATTSFQLHLKVGIDKAVRAFNAAKMLSAPLVAISANSPFLFDHELWEETRIPLFEQAISVGGSDYSKRVTFGIRYAEKSIMECFDANLERYPVLLPQLMDDPEDSLPHLRLHNGTIWRWNRPLVGFSEDGSPHIRIEHRAIPSGPTVVDMIANSAVYFGAMTELLYAGANLEQRLPFETAMRNFYAAARYGLDAEATWIDNKNTSMRELCLNQILPLAQAGLKRLGFEESAASQWLDIVRERVETGRTGSWWQRQWASRHGRDFNGLVLAYLENQRRGKPVHLWNIQ